MEGIILSISPHAQVIHLTHDLPPFNLIAAARTLEQVAFLPVGTQHTNLKSTNNHQLPYTRTRFGG
jgi:S-adenosylmethionine hydrolase